MVLIIAAVDASDDEAKLIIQTRRINKDKSIALNFALVQGFNTQTGLPTNIFYGKSNPGGSSRLHAERNAFKELCEAVGADFDQNSGGETAKNLRGKNICLFPKLYSELPPCPSCFIWLTNFAKVNRADVIIKYAEETAGYFEADSPAKRAKMFRRYIDGVITE